MNGEAVQRKNMSDDCALDKSQKRCFTPFYLIVYFYLCYVELSNCLFLSGIQVTQKPNSHIYEFILSNKVILCVYIHIYIYDSYNLHSRQMQRRPDLCHCFTGVVFIV